MTYIYFIRHSIPDTSIRDESRPLTKQGLIKANELAAIFEKIEIDCIFSSPHKRSIQTVEPISGNKGLNITIVDNFRERKIADGWIENFDEFCKKQWQDFSYKLENSESLKETQERNIKSLKKILEDKPENTIIIGTHGTSLSTIINYYDKTYGYSEFKKIEKIMPYIIKLEFNKNEYAGRTEILI